MIEIVSYNERWPEEFAAIASVLRRALGDVALRIDHIGSTSVPGLAAKDRIDIQVTVPSIELVDVFAAPLVAAGYEMRDGITRDHAPPHVVDQIGDWEKRFFRPPVEQRPTNLHVRAHGRANQRYALLFRDYLRAHPASAAGYAEVKRRLAQYHPDDIDAYVEIKDPVCDIIMAAAEEWAMAHSWQPGPSDA